MIFIFLTSIIMFRCIQLLSKNLNIDNIDINNDNNGNITKDKNINKEEQPIHSTKNNSSLVSDFKLPIQYLDETQLFNITDVVSGDLELVSNQNEKNKSMYDYLFKPKHSFAKDMIPEWNKYYTNNTEYLNDTKEVLNDMNIYREKIEICKYNINCDKINEIWKETKQNEDFLAKYSFVEWDMFKHLNQSSSVLQILSFINIASPIVSFILPFLLLLFPFIILKIQNIPITFSVYLEVLKSIGRNHFIGKALENGMGSLSFDKIVYMIFLLGIYLLQIYQNITLCNRMYSNMKRMNEDLCELREYANYSITSMENFIQLNKNKYYYKDFCRDVENHCNKLKQFHNMLIPIQPFRLSLNKMNEMGLLMKCYYELHSNKEYEETIKFSIGFEGYINNLLGVFENLENNVVSYANFDISGNCNIEKQYYPPLIDENPVKNDCSFDKNMIISSPNAGGKTTIIKTTTINIIFSQQVGCGFYKSCSLNPYTHIHSYLNIPDTSGRDSLFQAESRRCKDIIDIINNNDIVKCRHFCIFDELYSGTNPKEATKSAYAFLLYLSKFKNVNFMLTTHYVSICSKFKKSKEIQNYKMNVENLENGALKYTYKMKKGISKIQGAIKILEQMNYPDEIIHSVKNYI